MNRMQKYEYSLIELGDLTLTDSVTDSVTDSRA